MTTALASLLAALRPPPGPILARMALALALGTVGGAAAVQLGVPLPWMLGSMIACAVAAFAHAPLSSPIGLRPFVIPILGVMLGSGFHPALLGHLSSWAMTFLLLPPFLAVTFAASYAVFRGLGRYDPVTAFFSAAPGGLNEMILMGGERGGDETRISLAHAVRVFAVISAIALIFAIVFDVRSSNAGAAWIRFADLGWFGLFVLGGCAALGPALANRLGLPAASLVGPMALSAGVHLSGLVPLPPPTLLVIVAQVVIGTTLGCRFVGASLAQTGRDLVLGVAATAAMLASTAVFSVLVALVSDTTADQAMLAFSPGGLAEMSLLALAMDQDVAYVATLHVVRIVLVLLAVPILVRFAGKRLFGHEKR